MRYVFFMLMPIVLLGAASYSRGADDEENRQRRGAVKSTYHTTEMGAVKRIVRNGRTVVETEVNAAGQIVRITRMGSTRGDRPTGGRMDATTICLVSLLEDGEEVTPSKSYTSSYRGKTYYFKSARHRQSFRADPSKYLRNFFQRLTLARRGIALGGFSPVSIEDQRKLAKGTARYSAQYKKKTYWLTSAAELERFEKNPRKYTSRAQYKYKRLLPAMNESL